MGGFGFGFNFGTQLAFSFQAWLLARFFYSLRTATGLTPFNQTYNEAQQVKPV
ncbi:hypothetical protein P4S63_02130 [Pseudoalteromonas sp. B193]